MEITIGVNPVAQPKPTIYSEIRFREDGYVLQNAQCSVLGRRGRNHSRLGTELDCRKFD